MISRFHFNISFYESFKNIIKIFFHKKNSYDDSLKNELSKIYNSKSFYFFDHGRTALYEALEQIKKKTDKRKILINSLTLFEIVNIIIYAGFKPIFIDNKENSFETEINLNNLKDNLNEVAAIIITHLNGVNLNIINLKNQIDNHNKKNKKIYLIEDCAVALGSKIENKNVGLFGDFSFLSFNIMKNITSYTGGILIDNNKEISFVDSKNYKELSKFYIIKKMLFVFTIQLVNSKIFFPIFFKLVKYSYKYSFNFFLKKYRTDFEVRIEKKIPSKFLYFMHSFQKRLLLSQFKDFKNKQLDRIKKSEIYFNGLKELKKINFPQTEFNEKSIFLEFPIICQSKKMKDELFNYLMDKKIDVKNYYYKNCSDEQVYSSHFIECTNSRNISNNILMLPVHQGINLSHQNLIIKEIINFFH